MQTLPVHASFMTLVHFCEIVEATTEFFSVWNMKYLSSSFCYPFFPLQYFDTVYCYDVYRVASSVVCPGGRSHCPQNQTCCPSTRGGYLCCPDPNVSILYSLFTAILSSAKLLQM